MPHHSPFLKVCVYVCNIYGLRYIFVCVHPDWVLVKPQSFVLCLQTFENVLKSWSEKQKLERPVSPQPSALSEDEAHVLLNFVEAAAALIRW